MPVQTTYPGVYVEEIPSGVRTISGVSTSVTAFVGFLKRGPLDESVRVLSFGDFERIFGGLDADSEVSYAVQQFFLNGGSEAWIVRTAADDPASAGTDPNTSSVTLNDEAVNPVLDAQAANAGQWGDSLQIDIDHDGSASGLFNLTVTEFVTQNGETVAAAAETFRNLSMNPSSSAYALEVVNDGSKLLRLAVPTSVTHTATASVQITGNVFRALSKARDIPVVQCGLLVNERDDDPNLTRIRELLFTENRVSSNRLVSTSATVYLNAFTNIVTSNMVEDPPNDALFSMIVQSLTDKARRTIVAHNITRNAIRDAVSSGTIVAQPNVR